MASKDGSFENVLEFIRTNRGFDFTGYKRPSLQRRITKRMETVGLDSYDDYLVRLETHPEEFVSLFDTILINVTSFFRDPEAWDYLAREIVPRIAQLAQDAEIRVWVPGCASGEEAYTVAMLLCEELGEERFRAQAKIYATDVDEEALVEGRHARYSAKQLEPVPPELLERYFEPVDGSRIFRTDLRRNVIFGRHDLIQDPPISRIDLLVVRNTLMYFNPETQSRILSQLHFALRDSGFLFLGKSEVLLTRSNLFVPIELRHRIFAKKGDPHPRKRPVAPPAAAEPRPDAAHAGGSEEELRHAALEMVPLAQIAVDLEGRLVLANIQARTLFGLGAHDIGRLLQDLEVSYRPLELRSLIERSLAERHQVSVREVERRSGTDVAYFDVQVAPLQNTHGAAIGTTVTFADVTRDRRLQESLEDSKSKLETAFEELQSTAEELETTNEELQSTNEELETMNEELQSTNEELETINDELRERTIDLHEANAFLESILVSVEAGFVVLDRELRVRTWNDHARELWGLRVDEVEGQHLVNLDIGLPTDGLLPLIRATLAGEENRHQVVLDATNRRGRRIRCRVTCSQLLSATNEVQGAILLMEEVAGTD
jgi:two-component system CheB/CheR fusion protein